MLLAALVLAQAAALPNCGGDTSYGEIERCEVRRGRNDILDAAGRPSASALGSEAIRFSYTPAMPTGRAIIVELVPDGDREASVRFFWLTGNWEAGWRMQGLLPIFVPAERYRQLASTVDRLLGRYESSPPPQADNEGELICLDGPGFGTERVRGGQVTTLRGWCPRRRGERHPNPEIAALLLPMICDYLLRRYPGDRRQRRDCDRWGETARGIAPG